MFNGGMFIGSRDIYTVQGCSKDAGMFNGSGIYLTSRMLIESCAKGAGMFQGNERFQECGDVFCDQYLVHWFKVTGEGHNFRSRFKGTV